jgi:tRNA G10  N-methylase Trm11
MCVCLAKGMAAGGSDSLSWTPRRPRSGVLKSFALHKLPFTGGPTTMEPEIALLMANLCGAVKGARVLDPFCGSASLLLAAR